MRGAEATPCPREGPCGRGNCLKVAAPDQEAPGICGLADVEMHACTHIQRLKAKKLPSMEEPHCCL